MKRLYTYQDFEVTKLSQGVTSAVQQAIVKHISTEEYRTALLADEYDAQRNTTMTRFVKTLYDFAGRPHVDNFTSNAKICSNFFNRLNTQRMAYSLGNGVSFEDAEVKELLGPTFDTRLRNAAYYSLIHGVSYVYLNVDHIHVYKTTEFAPLFDEETGELKAGVRWWQIDAEKPVMAVLYEVDGYTRLRGNRKGKAFEVVQDKKPYRTEIVTIAASPEPEIVGEENYGSLPIVPLYGSRLHQSTLVGMRSAIDNYDLVRSGFANDLTDCAQIYWIVNNAGGMSEADYSRFLDRLKLFHIAGVENSDEVSVTPYTQDIPHEARSAFLNDIRAGIYEDFGGLDVHTVNAGDTNDHIQAAYQPMDENADDFEYQIIDCVQQLLKLVGVEGQTPLFKRNRICNQKEQTEMVLGAATVVDHETILNHIPWLTTDEVSTVLERVADEQIETQEDVLEV